MLSEKINALSNAIGAACENNSAIGRNIVSPTIDFLTADPSVLLNDQQSKPQNKSDSTKN